MRISTSTGDFSKYVGTIDLLYDIGKYMLEAYNCFEE